MLFSVSQEQHPSGTSTSRQVQTGDPPGSTCSKAPLLWLTQFYDTITKESKVLRVFCMNCWFSINKPVRRAEFLHVGNLMKNLQIIPHKDKLKSLRHSYVADLYREEGYSPACHPFPTRNVDIVKLHHGKSAHSFLHLLVHKNFSTWEGK